MPLKDNLKGLKAPKARKGPLWKGPEEDGITFSLLSRFLVCRERFRLLTIEGLQGADGFNHRLEFGNMWHICEQSVADGGLDWERQLRAYARGLCVKYRTQQEQVDLWYHICKAQFPIYVDYWSRHPDVKDRTPLLAEEVFGVPYRLPSGRTVKLKGKWDSVDLIGKGKTASVYIQENKTKSQILEGHIKRQLSFDLQTMIYVVALEAVLAVDPDTDVPKGNFDNLYRWANSAEEVRVSGVRYNVVRRTLHRQGKKEDRQQFADRVAGLIKEAPQEWFMRWKVEISAHDVARFRRECLDPILEQLCDWWEWVDGRKDPFEIAVNEHPPHWRHPFGVYNSLDEGGSSDLDEYLSSGSEVGLRRAETLFPELEGA